MSIWVSRESAAVSVILHMYACSAKAYAVLVFHPRIKPNDKPRRILTQSEIRCLSFD